MSLSEEELMKMIREVGAEMVIDGTIPPTPSMLAEVERIEKEIKNLEAKKAKNGQLP